MAKFSFKGLIAPVFTAFNNDSARSLNLKAVPGYAKYLADNGIKGVLVNGTTGQGMSQSVQERKILAETWMKAKQTTGQHVMVQVGGAPLPDALELAKHAESIGVDSILSLPELYYRPTSTSDLIRYLQIIGEAAPNTPLLYYHIPRMSNVQIHMGEFIKEVDGKIPTFAGMKFTSEEFDEGREAINAYNKKYAIFYGGNQYMLEGLTHGFDSGVAITVNMFPQLGVQIYENFFNGDIEKAKPIQEKLLQAVNYISKHGMWTQTMKEAMNLFTPINLGPPREPIPQLSSQQIKQMDEEVKSLKI